MNPLRRGTRRLLSTLSSTPNTFPPPEALSSRTATKPFQPQAWVSLQPPPATSLHAFASRLRLFQPTPQTPAPPADLTDILTQALTHRSFLSLHADQKPDDAPPRTNIEWDVMGNHLLGLFAAEYVHASWPHLPTRVVKAAVSAYVGPETCSDIAREWGVANLVRWSKTRKARREISKVDALASVTRSMVALIYQHMGMGQARTFVQNHILSREVDLRQFIKFQNPMKALQETVKQFGRDRPVSRLLKETGRYSISPVYVVGVFSGEEKLGEGFGSSLRMAEFRASEDALRRLYLTKTPSHILSIPTSTFPLAAASEPFLQLSGSPATDYTPGDLGEAEVLYCASDKTVKPLLRQPLPEDASS